MKPVAKSAVVLIALFFGVSNSFAALDGRGIMEKQEKLQKSKTEFEVQKMILVDKKGNKEERSLKRYSKEVGKDLYRTLVVFTAPSDIAGTALLTWQNKGGKDDQWLYMPAQGSFKRISQSSKTNYFMGTDYTYFDMEPEDMDSNNYKVIKEEPVDGEPCYVVEATPVDKKAVRESGYSKRVLWITKKNFNTVKTEFFDRRGKALKTQTNKSFSNVGGTKWRAAKAMMDNTKKKHRTLIGSVSRKVNEPISDDTFQQRFVLQKKYQ